ncbi:MAG: hypothetical protein IPG96_16305 [Proteobacteria bacterium]|nr:hypothetical protein [Pseudomonadota bacterium]
MARPSLQMKVPAAQVRHAVQEAVLVRVLKVPLAHAAQRRSAVVVPSLATYCPAVQFVFLVQSVAALPSWSHVPAAQATGGALPPAQ